MAGIYFSNLKNHETLGSEYPCRAVHRDTEYNDWYVQQFVTDKFQNDKVFYENEDYIILTDGIVLNSKKLADEVGVTGLTDYILYCLNNSKADFWDNFRGSFVLAVFDKKQNKWTAACNQMGDRMLFYWCNDSHFICTSSLKVLADELKKNGYQHKLNKTAAYNLLTFSFMQDNETLIDNIYRINPGCYIEFDGKRVTEHSYHIFTNLKTVDRTEEEYIELIDQKFRNAVRLQMEKDVEYGYEHLASLSSGLDARMTVRVATDMGYPIHTITFSESQFIDETVAERLAEHMRTTHTYMTLDDGRCMYNLEKVVRLGYGMTAANHTMHAIGMMEMLNLDRFGMLHTGQIGDAVIGSLCSKSEQEAVQPMAKPYSRMLEHKNKDQSYKKYENLELEIFYTRAFRGAIGAQTVHYHYIEMFSPFCDVDFFEFCLSIPLKYRVNHYIYKKWIIAKYPDVAEIVWGTTGKPLTLTETKFTTFAEKAKNKFLRIIKGNEQLQPKKNIMTPYDYWFSIYNDISNYYDELFEELIYLVVDTELREDVCNLYLNGKVREKIQALTLLLCLRNFIG